MKATWLPAPLSIVTLALSDKAVADLPHVASLISSFLDCSLNIPLHQACATGSLALLDRIWFHSQLPRREDWRWCPAASLQTNRHYKRWQFSQSLIQAIRRRDLALVDWIFRHFKHCVSDVEVVEEAASTGQLEILKFLLEKNSGHTQEEYEAGDANDGGNGVTWGGDDMELAMRNGHSDVVRWLLEHTSIIRRKQAVVLMHAVLSGNLPIVKLLISRGFRMEQPLHLVNGAGSEGHLELLQWLLQQNLLGEGLLVRLSSKHLNVNTWLVEAGLECGPERAFVEACGEGQLSVLGWLANYMKTKGGFLFTNTAESAMESAARNGHLEVVKWLIERGFPVRGTTYAIHFAAARGHLEVAKYLHAQGFTGCNQGTLRKAAKGGHLAVVQWLWNQFEDDSKTDLRTKRKREECSRHSSKLEMDYVVTKAAKNGHLDVVQWVCTHTTVNSTKEAIASAASRGHFLVVKWLHENRPNEGSQTEVMDATADYGDLSLLKCLHTNRPDEGWSTVAIDNAARRGHLHVLRWLLDHKLLYKDSMPMDATHLALMGNHFDALLLLHHEYKDWSSEPVYLENEDDDPYNEHMMAWFQENLRDSSEAD